MRIMKSLIVDDERSIRNSLKEILEMEGYQVDTAENGATACDMAEKPSTAMMMSGTFIICRTIRPLRTGLTNVEKKVRIFA